MKFNYVLIGSAITAVLAGCALLPHPDQERQFNQMMHESFASRGQAGMDRLTQDAVQKACSRSPSDGPLPADQIAAMEKSQMATVIYPVDGVMTGNWREGEKIAQSGFGKQYSDDPALPSGGNCYACHQMAKSEIAFGTLGPSLYNYGKIRGQSPEIIRYTYAKIFNSQAYAACSIMPRFGHNAILTEQQIKDVLGFLFDPQSPVNQ